MPPVASTQGVTQTSQVSPSQANRTPPRRPAQKTQAASTNQKPNPVKTPTSNPPASTGITVNLFA